MPKKTKPLKINELVLPAQTKSTVYVSGYNSDGVYVIEVLDLDHVETGSVTTKNSFTEPPHIRVVIK